MFSSKYSLATAAITLFAAVGCSDAFAPAGKPFAARAATTFGTELNEATKNENVLQTEDTKRDKVMTFSYDMSLELKYEKPTYPGTGNGLSGDEGEYDVIVIGSGMGGLACGALSAKYGDKVLVLESHIKVGGSAHTFTRVHNGEKYSFEVGPSIFEGLDRSLKLSKKLIRCCSATVIHNNLCSKTDDETPLCSFHSCTKVQAQSSKTLLRQLINPSIHNT